jgi:hypothetical protein
MLALQAQSSEFKPQSTKKEKKKHKQECNLALWKPLTPVLLGSYGDFITQDDGSMDPVWVIQCCGLVGTLQGLSAQILQFLTERQQINDYQ